MVTASPMPNPPILGARESTAVPHTAVTRKNVSTASTAAAQVADSAGCLTAAPRCVAAFTLSGKAAASSALAATAPKSCETQ